MKSIISLAVTIIEIPLSFGFIIAFFKFFNGEDVKAFDFLSLGFSNFKKSWGVSLHIALKLIVPIILIIVSVILIAFGVAQAATSVLTGSSGGSGLTVIGFILYIVGFIWVMLESYYYQLAYIVAADGETLTSKEVVVKCKEIMQGKRWKLFCLQFSFIGWTFLAGLTFGIGMLWLLPYIQCSMIAFAKDALGNTSSNPNINVDKDEDVNPIQ